MDILLLILRLTLAALLYVFLGAVLLMLWRDLRRAPAERAAARPQGRLVVVEAASDESEQPSVGSTFPLQPVTSIGRSPTNTIVIADTYASSQHALLIWREGHWWVKDQESRNGTLLNGKPVKELMLVDTGDVIGLGRTKLRLEID